jgi:hypothetical protein
MKSAEVFSVWKVLDLGEKVTTTKITTSKTKKNIEKFANQ